MAKTIASLVLVLFVVAIINGYSVEGVVQDCPHLYYLCYYVYPNDCSGYYEMCTPNKGLESTVAKCGNPKAEILP